MNDNNVETSGDDTDTPFAPTDVPTGDLISDADDRYDLIGLDIVNRESGMVEAFTPLGRGEIDMPGYVESVEGNYATSEVYRAVRVWRTHTRPSSTR